MAPWHVLLVLVGAMLVLGCQNASRPTPTVEPASPPTPTSVPASPTTAQTPTAAPTMPPPTTAPSPERPSPTSVPASSRTYTSSLYQITLHYPEDWQPRTGYEDRFGGTDGFFQVSALGGADLDLDAAARLEAEHLLMPYGSQPTIESLRVDGQEARLILPSADQPSEMDNQAALIVLAPEPITIDGSQYPFLVIWSDRAHIRAIAATVHFLSSAAPKGTESGARPYT